MNYIRLGGIHWIHCITLWNVYCSSRNNNDLGGYLEFADLTILQILKMQFWYHNTTDKLTLTSEQKYIFIYHYLFTNFKRIISKIGGEMRHCCFFCRTLFHEWSVVGSSTRFKYIFVFKELGLTLQIFLKWLDAPFSHYSIINIVGVVNLEVWELQSGTECGPLWGGTEMFTLSLQNVSRL